MGSEAATVLASAEARSTRDKLLKAAAALVDGRDGPGGFVRDLFGRASPEDLAPYAPEALADLALAARAHLAAPRRPGTPSDLRLSDLTVDRDGRPRELTVVEVVNDNRPFLLASALAELTEQGLTPHLVAHPILGVERDADGALVRVVGETTADAQGALTRESFIHLHLDRLDAGEARDRLEAGLTQVFRDVARATDDHDAMEARLAALTEQYGAGRPSLPAAEVAEAHAFLAWLRDGHFTLLGLREYALAEGGHAAVPEASLGVLRDPALDVLRGGQAVADDAPEIRAFLEGPQALLVTKSSIRSRVHRAGHLDYIGIKRFAEDGHLAGEVRLVGLFTAAADTALARDIPYLREKVAAVIACAGLDPTSHAGRSLLDVLETYPRDDLFQIETDQLYRFALAIGGLAERPRIRVLPRPDRFGRFVSILVYVPKDRYDTQLRTRIGLHLARAYGGRLSAAYPHFPAGSLVRTHYIVGLSESGAAEPDPAPLEAEIGALVRTWGDELRLALAETRPGREARALAARYAEAFSAAYRENFTPDIAIADIAILEALSDARPRAADIGRRDTDGAHQIRLKVFSRGMAVSLSDRVPALENLGFRVINERTYRIRVGEGPEAAQVWLHDMLLERATGAPIDRDRLEAPLEAALLAIAAGEAESDGYNRLVLEADLGWRDVALLRGLGRYLRQLRVRYGQGYLAATLAQHPAIAAGIVALFHARFDPAEPDRTGREAAIRAEIETALSGVTSLDEDRILRRFVNLVEAAVRTNFFQTRDDGAPRETIAFKFACAKVSGMPLPRPFFEIFVYAPRLEGVHLRYGYVARGGLRWSDRPEDFRTEILGLVKAQQVKNAVIVPVGAKGGFFPKRLPPASDREAWLAEGTESYRIFIRTLLELTDNIVDAAIRPPADTVRHDPDDAYLVVAADKGTATFSDIANALSLQRGHWLGDAFASGGSQGYDHKRMGITARGAWEAVKRHFREMDIDIQADPVTVAGVGDMSGDVFGNGMLLSRSLKLVAAFDHRDIFLDPTPDPAASFAERRRLFELARSSWRDYDAALISRGGGVFSRSLKTIPLSPEIQRVLGVAQAEATPAEVMQAILKAPVDLLWFGGIGTYIRAGSETDEEAGDRANDAVRITGASVRAKVIGEGANLGSTQRGRIEAARAGVRLNTDAIDNSAGVNTSDVEVNIKIALMGPERDGRLDAAARNALLVGMTDEVAALVLRNNELQTLALSLALRRRVGETAFAVRTLQALEAEGRLDRAVEFLPDDAAIAERLRRGEGLTRPEYAVLLAYAKLSLYDAILASPVPNDPYFDRELQRYFPLALRNQFPDAVKGHRLRREIIATALSNIIVNRGGPSLVTRLIDETGADAATIAKAYVVTRDAFGLMELNLAIDKLAGAIPGQAQLDLYADVQDLLTGRIVWFIRNLDLSGSVAPLVARYRDGLAAVMAALPEVLDADALRALDTRQADLTGYGLAPDAARRLASLAVLSAGPDIVRVAEDGGRPVAGIAATHFALAQQFRLDDLVAAARKVPVDDIFDRAALERAVSGISTAHRRLTAEVVADVGDGPEAVDAWIAARGPALARIRQAVETIAGSGLTVSKATVAASLLGDLARA